nr:putative RNA-directed DNA polymerase, eukaryota, reverse transcriptase zinc-binding domain protein [Tanacetum cinerariifolium]
MSDPAGQVLVIEIKAMKNDKSLGKLYVPIQYLLRGIRQGKDKPCVTCQVRGKSKEPGWSIRFSYRFGWNFSNEDYMGVETVFFGENYTKFECEGVPLPANDCIGVSAHPYRGGNKNLIDQVFRGLKSRTNAKNLSRILICFHLTSGKGVNFNKRKLCGVGVTNSELSSMDSMIHCLASQFPCIYLGLLICAKMSRCHNWKPLVDRFHKRLSKWKSKSLPFGGRLTLVRSVLGSLGVYYLSNFKALKKVICNLKSIRRHFFWGGCSDEKKVSWIAWDKVISPRVKEGLSIGSLSACNQAMLSKWWWRIKIEDQAIWCRLICSIHGPNGGLHDNSSLKPNLGPWYHIMKLKDDLLKLGINLTSFFKKKIENGCNTSFWKDNWLGGSHLCIMFPRLYRLDSNPDCKVNERSPILVAPIYSSIQFSSPISSPIGFVPPPAIEALNIALLEATNNNIFHGIQVCKDKIPVSHLQFADDALIIEDWSRTNAKNLSRLLICFYLASGQKLLIDRFHKRLSKWKSKSLSFGGRLTLVRSVLGSLGVYYFSSFKAPKKVICKFENIRRHFFWGGCSDEKKISWIAWDKVISPRVKGGLSIGSLSACNQAML